MECVAWLDMASVQCYLVLQLLSIKDQALLILRNAFYPADLVLHLCDCACQAAPDCHWFTCESPDVKRHVTATSLGFHLFDDLHGHDAICHNISDLAHGGNG